MSLPSSNKESASAVLDAEMLEFIDKHKASDAYVKLAEEMHILIEMVFGIDHHALSLENKGRLKDLHDVIDHYRARSAGAGVNVHEAVKKDRERVETIMDTYRWVINEVRSRYSASQLKYVENLVDYLDDVQRLMARYLVNVS